MEPKGSLPHSQEPTIVPYPEPQRRSSHLHNLTFYIHINLILQRIQFLTSRLSP
jgi:hypothetical protein